MSQSGNTRIVLDNGIVLIITPKADFKLVKLFLNHVRFAK